MPISAVDFADLEWSLAEHIAWNLRRSHALRVAADWLENNLDAKATMVIVAQDGTVRLYPGWDHRRFPYREGEVHNLYSLADQVGADVTVRPDDILGEGWRLSARWTVDDVPFETDVHLPEAATNVHITDSTSASDAVRVA